MTIWQKSLNELRKELSPFEFKTWMKPINVTNSGNLFSIYCNNNYIKSYIQNKYGDVIAKYLREFNNSPVSIEFLGEKFNPKKQIVTRKEITAGPQNHFFKSVDIEIKEEKKPVKKIVRPSIKSSKSKIKALSPELLGLDEAMIISKINDNTINTYGLPLKEKYIFNNFVVADTNNIARAAAEQVSINPGKEHNPLFIYGGSGLGKTHLIQAIANNARQINPSANIIYTNSEQFIKDYVTSIRLQERDKFQDIYRSVDILLIDDIQFIAGKDGIAKEFFHTFNALNGLGKQIVLTSDKYPNEIEGLEERLVSRFSHGLTVSVDMPDLETRLAILYKKSGEQNVKLPHQTAIFIAESVRTNIRELEGALNNILAVCKFKNKNPTINIARECLRDVVKIKDKKVKIDNIQKIVAHYYRLKVKDLISSQRSRNISRPRQIAMSLSRELTSYSLPEIGEYFGGRDHTTVMYAIKSVAKLRKNNSTIADEYSTLLNRISN